VRAQPKRRPPVISATSNVADGDVTNIAAACAHRWFVRAGVERRPTDYCRQWRILVRSYAARWETISTALSSNIRNKKPGSERHGGGLHSPRPIPSNHLYVRRRKGVTTVQQVFTPIDREAMVRRDQAVARLDALATLMDAAFVIPGTTIRMGLDGLIGLLPIAGDLISSMVSSYIVWEARQLGVPRWMIARMMLNVVVDTAVGSVPVVGDAFDVMFRVNIKNMTLLKRYLERQAGATTGAFIEGSR
jgi:hypothetical protein